MQKVVFYFLDLYFPFNEFSKYKSLTGLEYIFKVELKLNKYHHKAQLVLNRSDKFYLKLDTISTFEPFDKILVLIDHTYAPGKLKSVVDIQYHSKFVLLELEHSREDKDVQLNIEGNGKIQSSFSYIKNLETSYKIILDTDNNLEAVIIFDYNESLHAKLMAKGIASFTNADINFEVEHNFGKYPIIKGELKHTVIANTVNTALELVSEDTKLKTGLKLENSVDLKIDWGLDIEGIKPLSVWVKYSVGPGGRVFQSEVVYENIQIIAVNFNFFMENISNFKVNSAMKIILRKITFRIENTQKEKLFYFDNVIRGKLTTKINIGMKNEDLGNVVGSIINVEIHTPFETFDKICISSKQKWAKGKFAMKSEIKYQDFFWYNDVVTKDLKLIVTSKTNFFPEIVEISLDRNFDPSQDVILVKSVYGNRAFNIERIISEISPTKNQFDLKVTGTWGNIEIQGSTDFQKDDTILYLFFKDRKGLVFTLQSNIATHSEKYLTLSTIKTPFTDDLKIVGELEMLNGIAVKLNIFQPHYSYAEVFFKADKTRLSIDAKIDVKKLVNLPLLDLKCKAEISNETITTWNGMEIKQLEVNFTLDADKTTVVSNVIKIKRIGSKVSVDILVNSSHSAYKVLRLAIDLDASGNDKSVNITAAHNDQEYSFTLKLSRSASRYLFLVNMLTPFPGFTTLGLEGTLDQSKNSILIKMKKENKVFVIHCGLVFDNSVIVFQSKLETTMHAWKEMNILGKLDLFGNTKSINFHGSSDDQSQSLNIKLTLNQDKGDGQIQANLPFIGIAEKQFSFSYFLAEDNIEITADFNSDVIVVKLRKQSDMYIYNINTPFAGLTQIEGKFSFIMTHMKMNCAAELVVESLVNSFYLAYDMEDTMELNLYLQTQFDIVKIVTIHCISEKNNLNVNVLFNSFSMKGKVTLDSLQDVKLALHLLGKQKKINVEIGYSMKEDEKQIHIDLQLNQISLYTKINISPEQLLFHSKIPMIGQTNIEVSCSNGNYFMMAKHNDIIILEATFGWAWQNMWTGAGDIEIKTLLDYVKQLSLKLKFDSNKMPDKAMYFYIRYNKLFIEGDLNCKAYHDTFDGKMVFKSSFTNWEDVILNASYSIDAEPDAKISITRNGIEEEMFVKVLIEKSNITTEIKTPFYGYELIKLIGRLNADKSISLRFDLNGEKLVIMNTHFQMINGFQSMEIKSVISTPLWGHPDIYVDISYNIQNIQHFKMKYTRGSSVYDINANITLEEKAFKVDIKSPYDDLSIAGQFGTTELKTSYTFGKDRNKREASLEYKLTDDAAEVILKSPQLPWTGIKFSAGYRADAKAASFNLETQGDNNDIEFSLQYDFSNVLTSGNLFGKLVCPSLILDYQGTLEYVIQDGSAFSGNFEFEIDTVKMISGKIERVPGRTEIIFTTPVEGWNIVKLRLDSDWSSTVALELCRDGKLSSITVERNKSFLGFLITIVTPYADYENITVNVEVPENESTIIEIQNNGTLLTRITIDVKFSFPEMKVGSLLVKWEALNDKYIICDLTFRNNISKEDHIRNMNIEVTTSFTKLSSLKIMAEQSMEGSMSSTNGFFKFNDLFMNYTTATNWTNDMIDSKSEAETNIPFFGFTKSQTETQITYSKSLDAPFTLKFVSIQDSITTFEVFSSVMINIRNGELEMIYHGDFPLQSGKVIAKLRLRSDFNTKLEVSGELNSTNFKFKLIQVDGNAEVTFTSNIEHFENLKGTAKWKVANGPSKIYGIDAIFNYHDTKYLGFKMEFNTKPFTQIMGQLDIPGFIKEEVSLNIIKLPNKKYSISVAYVGFNTIDILAKVDLVDIALEVSIDNKTENRKWELTVQGAIKSKQPISLLFRIKIETPFSDKFTARIHFDLTSVKKEIETSFSFGSIEASLEASVLLSFIHSELDLTASCPSLGLEKFEISGRRDMFKFMKYKVNLNGKTGEVEMRNDITPESFDVGMIINLPMTKYAQMEFTAKGNTSSIKMLTGEFMLSISETNVSLKYIIKGSNLDIVLTTPLGFAKNITIRTDIDILKQYNLEASWDEQRIELKNEIDWDGPQIKINYTSTFETVRFVQFLFSLQEKNLSMNGSFSLLGSTISFNADIKGSDSDKSVSVNLFGDLIKFTGVVKYTELEKSIQIQTSMSTDFEIKFYAKAEKGDNRVDIQVQTLYKLPDTTPQAIDMKVSFLDELYLKTGSLTLTYNNMKISIEFGSTIGHVYFEAKSPVLGYDNLKMDINHQNGNLKIKIISRYLNLQAIFTRKITIYNFDIEMKMFTNTFRFDGKIDVGGRALQTFLHWNSKKLSMKANYSGKSITISLKSPFQSFRNLLFKGSWEEISNGFTVSASGEMNSEVHQFQAKFTRDNNQTIGFWKAMKGNEEIRFDLNVEKSSDGKNIALKLKIPNLDLIETNAGFSIGNGGLQGKFSLFTPFDEFLTDMDLYFKYDFMISNKVLLESHVIGSEKLLAIQAAFSFDDPNNIILKTKLELPFIFKDLGAEFVFKPVSLYNFEFSTSMTLENKTCGSGIIFRWNETDVNVGIDVNVLKFQRSYIFGGTYKAPVPDGELKLFLNNANWETKFNNENGHFTAYSKINLSEFMKSMKGNLLTEFLTNLVEINIAYNGMESISLKLTADRKGDAGFKMTVNSEKILCLVQINFPEYGVAKSAEFVWKMGSTGAFQLSLVNGAANLNIEISNNNSSDHDGLNVRRARAVISSPSLGKIALTADPQVNQGVVVISTASGLHKLSYDVKERNGYEITIHAESPLLENGYATTKFSIDTLADVYRGRISVNNDHFVSGFVDITGSTAEFKLNLETPYLPNAFSAGGLFQHNDEHFKILLDILYKDKHSLTFLIDNELDDKSIKINVESAFLPWKTISLHSYYTFKELLCDGGVQISYGEELATLAVSTKFFSLQDFDFRAFCSISQIDLEDGKFKLTFKMNNDIKFKVRLEEQEDIFEIEALLKKVDNDIKGNLSITTHSQQFEIIINALEVFNDPSNAVLTMNIFTAHGESFGSLSWNFIDVGVGFEFKLELPKGQNYFVSFNCSIEDRSLFCHAKLPYFEIIQIHIRRIVSASTEDLINERYIWNIEILKRKYNGKVEIGYLQGFELKLSTNTPHPGYKSQEFHLGYGNTDNRKMLKLYGECFLGKSGVEIDFRFVTFSNFVVLFYVDFPLKNWSDFGIEITNQIFDEFKNIRLGGRYEESIAKLSAYISEQMTSINLQVNNIKMESRYINLESVTHFCDIYIQSNKFTSKSSLLLQHTEAKTAFSLDVDVNDQSVLKLSKRSQDNRVSLLIEDLILPSILRATFIYDVNALYSVGTLGLQIEFLFEKTMLNATPLLFTAILRKSTSGGDLTVEVNPMNAAQHFEIFLVKENLESRKLYNLKIVRNESTVLEVNALQHVSTISEWSNEKYFIISQYYNFEYNAKHEKEDIDSVAEANIKYEIPGSQVHGIGFHKHIKQLDGNNIEQMFIIRRPKGVLYDKEMLTFSWNSINKKNVIELKLDPEEPTNALYFKVQ